MSRSVLLKVTRVAYAHLAGILLHIDQKAFTSNTSPTKTHTESDQLNNRENSEIICVSQLLT